MFQYPYPPKIENATCVICGRSSLVSKALGVCGNCVKKKPDEALAVVKKVGVEEVESIASFIAGLDPDIPYSLLAFYPQFYMNDLPTTSKKNAIECMEAARKYLKRVRIGNVHLLS